MGGLALLSMVMIQRLAELVYARANTARLLAVGGVEHKARHYPLIIGVHVSWLVCLLWLAPGRDVNLFFFWVYAVLQLLRAWIFISLGRRWTTRIIIVPGETLVSQGPYKYFKHPNYMVVSAEIACLPMVFGLWKVAVLFSLLNAGALSIRIKVENIALESNE